MAARGHKNVGGLDVAMDDPFRMRRVQRVSNLNGQAKQNIGLDGLCGDAMLQRHAVQKFHDDEGLAVLLTNFIDGADIGMVQGRGRLRLSLEAGKGLGVFGDFIRQELQGDKPVQGNVLGLVNHTHPPAADLLDNAVMGYDLVDHYEVAEPWVTSS